MFTGLIQDIGEVLDVQKDGDWRIRIQTRIDLSREKIGASICCSGCCLTVVGKGDDWFDVEVSAETLSKTSLGKWAIGKKINLEPSLRMGDELGGHFVSGHVDCVAEIVSVSPEQDSHRVQIMVPQDIAPLIAPKGSVALDGISLTVNEVEDNFFGVNIIPHTWNVTTMGQCKAGGMLNLEIDMLARYVARQLGR